MVQTEDDYQQIDKHEKNVCNDFIEMLGGHCKTSGKNIIRVFDD